MYCSIRIKKKNYCFIKQSYLAVPAYLSFVYAFGTVAVAQLEDLDFSEQFL